jgi:hypothetical protein
MNRAMDDGAPDFVAAATEFQQEEELLTGLERLVVLEERSGRAEIEELDRRRALGLAVKDLLELVARIATTGDSTLVHEWTPFRIASNTSDNEALSTAGFFGKNRPQNPRQAGWGPHCHELGLYSTPATQKTPERQHTRIFTHVSTTVSIEPIDDGVVHAVNKEGVTVHAPTVSA